MKYAQLGPIAVYLPEKTIDNNYLRKAFPSWDMDTIEEKTGVFCRHIAGENEFVSDMAVSAAEKLLSERQIDRNSIDFILLCTQTPDYNLPTTACLVQHRLGLPITTGALDFNLGCSGFVYGLSLAQGLINGGMAKRILLITSENYTRYIDDEDRSLRTIFGDGATATLIDAADEPSIGPFVFSTDGAGADTLVAFNSGSRDAKHSLAPRGRRRWKSQLYMNGPELMRFGDERIPFLTKELYQRSQLTEKDIDFFLMHQATTKMLEQIMISMKWPKEKVPMYLRDIGNTVSSTIPFLIHHLRETGQLKKEMRSALVAFGVGLSAAICAWKETWEPENR